MTALLLSLLFVLPVVLLLGGLAARPRFTLAVEADCLHVRLGFWDALYCVRRSLRVPLDHIQGVAAVPTEQVPRTGMRLPGASIPRVIRAGSYGTGSQRDFWDVRRGRQLLVVEMLPGADYRRIVLEAPDPRAEALRLRPRVGAYTGTFRD